MTDAVRIIPGDVIDGLRTLPDGCVHCCVTSPPYWGLRDYGVDGQIGLEPTPAEYLDRIVSVFREVRRVLRDDGTVWVNIGDSYAANRGGTSMPAETLAGGVSGRGDKVAKRGRESGGRTPHRDPASHGLKHKDLIGIPWRLAFALQADGWWLRSDIIWAKPNPMPESVTDRPTKSHEYVFLLTKAERYWYDAEAIKEVSIGTTATPRFGGAKYGDSDDPKHATKSGNEYRDIGTRNARTVWSIATQPYPEAHFATFPEELPERCIKAGCPMGGTVLDPFLGSGTTIAVARQLGRNGIGCELNPEYIELARERIGKAERPNTYRSDKVVDSPLWEVA